MFDKAQFLMNKDLKESPEINITYSDDDLLVIDSVKEIQERPLVRFGMYVIAICLEGRIQYEVRGKEMKLCERQFIIFPPGTTVENPMTSPEYKCHFLCLTSNIINTQLHSYLDVWNKTMYLGEMKIWEMSETDIERVSIFFNLLKMTLESSYSNDTYRKEIIHSLLKVGLLELCSTLEKSMNSDKDEKRHSGNLFRQFLDILNCEKDKRQSVSYYANKLCISPKYLSVVCMKNSGKTAKQWINESIAENVRFYLKSTELSIKEITFLLGFPNTSYFSRYVKKNFGTTPMGVREKRDE